MATILETIMEHGKVYAGLAKATKQAKEDAEKAQGAEATGKRAALIALAVAADAGKWTAKDIAAACKQASEALVKLNLVRKTAQNFASKAKAAMHPNVRSQYANLCKMSEDIFRQEKAETSEARVAFRKPDFMIDALASAAAKEKSPAKMPTSEADIKTAARVKAKGKREDVGKCRDAITDIMTRCKTYKATFPLAQWDTMINLCTALCDENVLEDALAAKTSSRVRKSNKGASDIGTTLGALNE